MKKKTIYTTHVIDHNTGEVLNTSWVKKENITNDKFARAYIPNLKLLVPCTGAELSTVLCCLQYLVYDTNQILLTPDRREEIAIEADIKPNTVNVAISALYKRGVFIKVKKKIYLNPLIFYYGTDKGRQNLIEFLSTIEEGQE
jgi:hypothetical protein